MKIPGWQKAENLIYKSLNGGTINLAVTGLSRAGKTVFITSVAANLLAAGALEPSPTALTRLHGLKVIGERRLKSSQIISTGTKGMQRFPFDTNATVLSRGEAQWPMRTAAIAELSIELEFYGDSSDHNNSRDNPEKVAKLRLNMLDYPGEWLMDIPMLGQSYDEWSKQSLDLLKEKPRNSLSAAWRQWQSAHPYGVFSDDVAKEGAVIWQKYLHNCLEERLCFLQPARFIRSANDVKEFSCPNLSDNNLWFFPMERPPVKIEKSNQYYLMKKRFDNYRDKFVVEFFSDVFKTYSRQVILVDVLAALNGGEEVFNDTRRALAAINKAITSQSKDWLNRFKNFRTSSLTEKLLFIATKVDHLPKISHDSLEKLLRSMLEDSERTFFRNSKMFKVISLASINCTEETTVKRDDGTKLDMVIGKSVLTKKRQRCAVPTIPTSLMDDVWWEKRTQDGGAAFNIPEFSPPLIENIQNNGIQFLYLDEALEFLIGDKLK